MIRVKIAKESNYPVSSPKLKRKLKGFFQEKGIVSNAEVSVAIVGKDRMFNISRRYLKDKILHNVLSFTPNETKPKFIYPPNGTIHLGEIIICYPKAFEEAKEEGRLIEDKVMELIEHGALHLLGIHHD